MRKKQKGKIKMKPSENQIICGDCLKILPTLPNAKMIFADPPDNLGMKYEGFLDKRNNYRQWLAYRIREALCRSDVVWLSVYHKHRLNIEQSISSWDDIPIQIRQFIWHFTFGQNSRTDFISSYRPILRMMKDGAQTYPDAIRIPSARQTKYHDKRANPKGKLPDDVWEFSRVCGTFKDRKKWHPCQHPKELLRRIVRFSTKPGDLVIDLFAGSGNMLEVCIEEDRPCIAIDISEFYCRKISENTGIPVTARNRQ